MVQHPQAVPPWASLSLDQVGDYRAMLGLAAWETHSRCLRWLEAMAMAEMAQASDPVAVYRLQGRLAAFREIGELHDKILRREQEIDHGRRELAESAATPEPAY